MKFFGPARQTIGSAKEVVADHDARHPHVAGEVRQAVGGLLVTDGLAGLRDLHGRKASRSGILGHVGQALFGLFFLAFGLFFVHVFTVDGDATTTGTVTHVNRGTDTDGNTTCSVDAEFWVDGRPLNASSHYSSSGFCGKRPGSTVEVRYDSANPSDAAVDGGDTWWIWVFPAAGLLVLALALANISLSLSVALFGWKLVRAGRAMTASAPATSTDDAAVAEAVEEYTAAIGRLRGGPSHDEEAPVPYPATTLPPLPTGARPPAAPVIAPDVISPGWYRTADGVSERWHDGVAWTPHVRPHTAPRSS